MKSSIGLQQDHTCATRACICRGPRLRIRSTPFAWGVALCGVGLGLAACGARGPVELSSAPPVALDQRNVVVILVDTLRAGHLGAYGYGRNTSPYIDSLAEGGVVFDEAYSPSSYTRESVAALFTGRLPSESGSTGWSARPREKGIGGYFRDAGCVTGLFGESGIIQDPAFTGDFSEVEIFPLDTEARHHAPRLSERALEFARKHAGERFMMYVHYLDPHGEYYPPPDYAARFVERPPSVPLTLYRNDESVINVRRHHGALRERGFGPGQKDFEDWVGMYDAEIAHVDDAIRQLMEGLEALGVLDETIIVLTSDHGEEFFEHEFLEHAWTVYDEAVHVPLLFYARGALPPARVSGPVSTVRVLPTLLDLAGVSVSEVTQLPPPLFGREGGRIEPIPDSAPIISETHIHFRNSVIALRLGNWKYIAWQHWIPPETRTLSVEVEMDDAPAPFPLGVSVVREELYHVAEDPGERDDRAARDPEQLERMRRLLDAYRARCGQRQDAHSGPASPGHGTREALESLGYL